MHLMKHKLLFFIFSTLIILPGLFYLIISGLKLGIDFTGGALLEYRFEQNVSKSELEQFGVVTPAGENTFIIRTESTYSTFNILYHDCFIYHLFI
ncbi:MAG: Protein translocase subunit SecF [Candidatus Daviesbacteria bacterium GW2011_GWB1_36_5]|uniref:Protein translocase subunit SecF n=1 Tax=Candidatus Daviesbacteria bacterium GW2011_GWB1_36_5 TaxID=1618426 RepID=A0A0G0EPR1_9BACT|nr:MAG: Protein translocase subunit SecF [Candidatus Daviesbacteria bacterium GW2011_GWB1_36_5]